LGALPAQAAHASKALRPAPNSKIQAGSGTAANESPSRTAQPQPDWMALKPEMMPHLIREHEKIGRTLTEEETVTLLRSLGFEINEE